VTERGTNLKNTKQAIKITSLLLAAVVMVSGITTAVPVNAAETDSSLESSGAIAKGPDELSAESAVNEIEILNPKDIRGNITLPTENLTYDAQITWESSKPNVISDKEVENSDYDNTPAGVVTRLDVDTYVKLTATAKVGNATAKKEFDLIVKAAVEEPDLNSYLFTYFPDNEHEQIYFATGLDAFHFQDLNNGQPVLTSDIGDKGVRDPYVFRSAEGDKFYMIATDLKVQTTGWGNAQYRGSLSLVVWESYDLVNWSEPRLVDVGMGSYENVGCVWAPEAIYDELTGEYVVFWASMTGAEGASGTHQIVYYSKTRDFVTFTEATPYIDRETRHCIDTSMIKASDGKYYRVSADGEITIETSDTVLGEWSEISTLKSLSAGMNRYSEFYAEMPLTLTGGTLEGPELFKFNNEDIYGLYSDNYVGVGYIPVTTTDLADTSGSEWTIYTTDQYDFGNLKKRHGSILGITEEEYSAVMSKWNDFEDVVSRVTAYYKKGRNGTIQGKIYQTMIKGGDAQTVKAIPDSGYRFVQWSDGVMTAERTDLEITSNITVSPEFEKMVTVTYAAGTGGTIRGTAVQTINKGNSTAQVTAVANSGYKFSKWSDGVTSASRTDKDVTADMTVTALFTVTVPAATKVTLNKKSIKLGKGEKFTLTASVAPAKASQTVDWKSDKPSVVSVSNGKIRAEATGTAKITAVTANGKTATCTVTVKKAPAKIRFSKASITLKRGSTTTLNSKVKLSTGSASYSRKFTTSKKKVVSVVNSSTGKIKAMKKGIAKIKVKAFNGKTATIKVIVK